MFLLNHVDPKKASGKIAEIYRQFPPPFPIPEPVLMASVSPALAAIQNEAGRYYVSHPKLDYGLMAMINYIVASDLNYEYAMKGNSDILKQAGGMSDKDLENLRNSPGKAPLEDFQKALLLFVLKAVRTPEKLTANDVEELREYGWEDQHIYDAVNSAASLTSANILYKAFRR